MRSTRTARFALFALVAALVAPLAAVADDAPAARKKVVVHLSHATDDLHAALMAVKLAWGMQHRGAEVTLFLDLEGVRLADERQPLDLRWGGSGELADHWGAFIETGGKVVVCPHCAHATGLHEEHLREGARLDEKDGIAALLLEADLILDY